ncbi:MAG: undecaprenyl-diphosphatase [Actinobacteria bacterium]|nr:undecaprenyl-diphosphatase [Actinomycetota bacterium]
MDYRLFNLVNQYAGRSGALDALMTGLAKYGVALLALPLLYMWFRGNSAAKKAALLSLLSMAVALLINQVIGHIYFRPRPFSFHEVNLLVDRSTDPSFPSDHAAFVFGIAWLIWLQNRRIGYVALAMGFLVALSRVFIGAHYPGDVLGGALIGLVSALLVWNLKAALDPVTSFLISIARKLRLA